MWQARAGREKLFCGNSIEHSQCRPDAREVMLLRVARSVAWTEPGITPTGHPETVGAFGGAITEVELLVMEDVVNMPILLTLLVPVEEG